MYDQVNLLIKTISTIFKVFSSDILQELGLSI